MILHRARVLVLAAPLAVLVTLAAPAAAGESTKDRALLKAGVITRDDVPAGWSSEKATSRSPDRSITECKKIRTAVDNAKKKVPTARSREFSDPTPGGASAEDTVYAFRNAQAATRFFANYGDTDANACFERIARELAPSGSPSPPTVSPITDLEGVGDEAVGYEIALEVSSEGVTASTFVDFVLVRVGRAVVGFGFSNLGERIPDGPEIVQAVVARVAEAQASA